MNEINKPEINFTQPVMAKPVQPEVRAENKQAEDIKQKDYKEAAAAPGAEAAGRAQVMLNKADKVDNVDSDIQKIIDNPSIVDTADTMFNAAEKAGVPYPVAATFATQEVVK